jgi:soluble lytic murein transglycosylase-like protein
VRLELAGGGALTLSIERIDRVIADEVLAREAELERRPPPPAFSLYYAPGQDQPDTPYGDAIYESARRYGLNPTLVAAVVEAESKFDPRAVSRKGARGLMQLMPATARRLGFQPAELHDPEKNLDAGARYLRQLVDRYGELDLALAAYNAGEGAVDRHGGVPPYRETVAYVRRVYAALGLAASLAAGGV